jgi:hypothetical protein
MAISRNKVQYEKYKNNKTREKNKVRKITKYLTKNPNDSNMVKRIKELEILITKK